MNSMMSAAPGTELRGGYHLGRPLGRGGLGEVWLAVGPDGLPVALKLLPCDRALGAAGEVRALQAMRRLEHPHLLRTYRIWAEAGCIAIAMELAEGSLLDLLELYYDEAGGPMPAAHLCHYLRQAASALDFLNRREHELEGRRVAFRHCDVKPSNLLVLGGVVKVADFSLSVPTTSPLRCHRRAGTLEFAAPEVFQGNLSERTDQYALAVTYCLLRGGRLPFADTPPSFRMEYVRPLPDLSMLSEGERAAVARALDPVPQNRWASCGELMARLAEAVDRCG